MASRNVLKKPVKVKKPRAQSVHRATSLEAITLGGEPKFLIGNKTSLIKAFNWYNVFSTAESRTRWIIEYMTDNDYPQDQISIVNAKGKKFSPTVAYVARLCQRGTALDDKDLHFLNDAIVAFCNKHSQNDEVELDEDGMPIFVKKAPVLVKEKVVDISAYVNIIDELFDSLLAGEKVSASVYDQLRASGCSKTDAQLVLNVFKSRIKEFELLVEGKDDDLNEGYEFLTKRMRRVAFDWLQDASRDLIQLAKQKRVVRKNRKTKEKPIEKVVAHVKFQKTSKEYKLESLDPTVIVGAKVLWTFNTKNRILSVYIAKGEGSLSVKGTSIIGFDDKESISKKLRQPGVILPSVQSESRIGGLRILKNLTTTEIEVKGRMNEHTILLRKF